MGEFWGFVDWGAGCLALSVAVVFSFLLGVRTGRIRERNESVRSRIRQNKANMYRYKQQLASYQEQVVRLERERDSLVIRSEAYDRIETELTGGRRRGRLCHRRRDSPPERRYGADGLSPEDGAVGERDPCSFRR